MDSVLLSLPGAVPADEPDAGVAAHYGDPVAEQRALERGAGFVDRGDRGVITVSGADRLGWLHSLTSQHLEALAPGVASEALVLDPNGRVEHHLSLVDSVSDGDGTVWAHVEPRSAASLAAYLDSMRFMMRVEVADHGQEFAVVTVVGPDREKVVAGVPGDVLARHTEDEIDLFVPRERLSEVSEGLRTEGAVPVGLWAYEAHRIAAHRPRLWLDTDERTIPHEAGWIGSAVHLDKGCYRGQETVARVHNLGRPPRRLVLLHLDGSVDRLPARGSDVELDGRRIGVVGSSARHHELGPIALALVKRNAPVEAELVADGIAASQEVIVSPETGANVRPNLGRTPT